jgi:hypothetical protein
MAERDFNNLAVASALAACSCQKLAWAASSW